MQRSILIASGSLDRWTTIPVRDELEHRGYSVILYEADRVAQGYDPFVISIGNAKESEIRYKNTTFDPVTVSAAWYRRPNIFTAGSDPAIDESLSVQYRGLQRYMWDYVPEKAWLDSPATMRRAESKITQLSVARQLGFLIPDTIVSNGWEEVMSLPTKEVTFKVVDGLLNTREGVKVLYSTTLRNKKTSLPLHASPYPGIWQTYIEKAREWRVTVVGDVVFPAAIYTTKNAKNDWRQHQHKRRRVEFRAEEFPSELGKKCIDYLKYFGLRYGAFDFIEQPDGEVVFLEINPSGEYGWVEEELGFEITNAIIEQLVNIAESSDR